MGSKIRYVLRLDDTKPKEMPSKGDFQAMMQSNWGRHDHHVCELLCSDDIVSPYFDYDHKQETEATPAELDMHLALCRDKLQALFGADKTFDVGTVVVLQRHGWWMDSKNKKAFKDFLQVLHQRLHDQDGSDAPSCSRFSTRTPSGT